jgi:hypothetical protein
MAGRSLPTAARCCSGELESKQQIVSDFAACFIDHCAPAAIEFTFEELVKPRVFGLALGYEDVNDHDTLRVEPLLPLPEWEVTWDEQVRHNDARTVYEKFYCARAALFGRVLARLQAAPA